MKCSECGTVYNDSYAECPKCKTQPQEDLKKCPFCAELIKAEAVKCKHCKSDLLGSESKIVSTVSDHQEHGIEKNAASEEKPPSGVSLEGVKSVKPKSDEWWHNPKTRKKVYLFLQDFSRPSLFRRLWLPSRLLCWKSSEAGAN